MVNNNLILAVLLSVLILVGYQYLYVKPQQELYRQQVLSEGMKTPAIENASIAPTTQRDRVDIIKDAPRIPITTPELLGSINLKGARIDDLELTQYRESVDPQSPLITLLSPPGSAAPHQAYYAEFSWLADNPSAVTVPTADTEWTATDKRLSPDHALTLTWDNHQGLLFDRVITVDDHYMLTITDHVVNHTTNAVTLYPFGLIARHGTPTGRTSWVLHEGPLGVLNGTLQEYKYKKLVEVGKASMDSKGGWLGITDKYWLVAMIPPADEQMSTEFSFNSTSQTDPNQGYFQADFRGNAITLAPNASTEHVTHLFVGAKRLELLDQYSTRFNIIHFDRAIDFGWFYFLTKPFLYLLIFLGHWLDNFGLAILLFTVALKLLTLPLSLKSNHSMAKMKGLQPEIKRIQERFADDKVRQSQELMEFYKREKISPMSGCVPQMIQIPIFFALYKVLYVGIDLRQAPFFGWIHDMSMADPTSVLTLFGYLPVTLPMALHIGVWPILMGVSSFIQQRLSPQPPDQSQARMFAFMPILFTYMLAQMPAGLVIYWTWSNILSIAQQWYIMRLDAKRKIQ
jgi:YidC/Oxa1 family membrane protein insertase